MCCGSEDAAIRVVAGSAAHVELAGRVGACTVGCAGSRGARAVIIARACGSACARADTEAISLKSVRVDGNATRWAASTVIVADTTSRNRRGCITIARDVAIRWTAHEVSRKSSSVRVPILVLAVRIVANAIAYPQFGDYSTVRRDGRVDGAVVHLRCEVVAWIVTGRSLVR